ncbi:MAG: roadblock/LC7 domain-containing protein [Candidatus Cloacimonadota bacterium]|nr:MAG: roadblock/LC7 domain-containing protein [Candidatus Cloacimonadota bacterium]
MEKINKINQVEGIINCFFRLKDGKIIKTPQLVGNIDDVLPLLDSLLGSVKSTARELKMGKLKIILIEIDRGVFYIFEKEEYDCFLLSHNTGNFGLLKAILPRILAETST